MRNFAKWTKYLLVSRLQNLDFNKSPCGEYIKEAGRMQILPASFLYSHAFSYPFLPMLTPEISHTTYSFKPAAYKL